MTPVSLAQNGLMFALIFSAVGVLFAWAIWHVGRRSGAGLVIGVWLLAAVVVSSLMLIRIRLAQAALGLSAAQQARIPVFWWFLPMWVVAFGAVVFAVRPRVPTTDSRFSASMAARSLGAFWLGLVVYFMLFAALDIAGIIR